MTDIAHKQKKSDELEAGNERSYQELREATHGRFSMDTSDLRREMFMAKLVEWGLVTEEQMLDYNIEFHEKVDEALSGAWADFRAATKPKIALVQKPSKLVDGHGRPLS